MLRRDDVRVCVPCGEFALHHRRTVYRVTGLPGSAQFPPKSLAFVDKKPT